MIRTRHSIVRTLNPARGSYRFAMRHQIAAGERMSAALSMAVARHLAPLQGDVPLNQQRTWEELTKIH